MTLGGVKRSVQQAVAARARGRRAVRSVTVALAALATTSSAGLAWAASSTATGHAQKSRVRTHRTSVPKGATPERHQRRDNLPPPAGPVPGSLTSPPQATTPQPAAPTTDPYAYAPQQVYYPPVVSSGGS